MITLSREDRQRFFDNAFRGVINQNGFSYVNHSCRYRYKDMKCGIGHSISDEKYRPGLENHSVADMKIQNALFDGSYASDYNDRNFLRLLQTCHDHQVILFNNNEIIESEMMPLFIQKMQELAEIYGLSIPDDV